MDASRPLHVSLLVLVCSAAACMSKSSAADTSQGAATASAANDPAARKAIEAADSQFVAAFKSANATAAAALYEQDAVSMPPNQEPESGRAAIEKGLGDLFKQTGKVIDFTAQARDLDIYGDHAVEIGSYSMSFQPTGATQPMKDQGSFINYWRKQPDGSWRVHRDAIVSSTPMPGAPAPPAPAKK